jgi:hypothetical protein
MMRLAQDMSYRDASTPLLKKINCTRLSQKRPPWLLLEQMVLAAAAQRSGKKTERLGRSVLGLRMEQGNLV